MTHQESPVACKDAFGVVGESLSRPYPFILPFDGIWPQIRSKPNRSSLWASLIGKAILGERAWLGPYAVIRADGHTVDIGDDFHLGEMSTVHIAHALLPTIIGDRVTVARNAVVHACTIGDDCVFEEGVVILDGSAVESGVVIESGSVVFPRSLLKSGFVYAGTPAAMVRPLKEGELEQRAWAVQEVTKASLVAPIFALDASTVLSDDVFVATTARLSGTIEAESGVGIFYGCELKAADNAIVIGRNTNVQDNTVIDAEQGTVVIGRNTTVGHNVLLKVSTIGERSLIGIGSVVEVGTAIDDDVLLAAGSFTEPGQHLERGWLWAGRPARPLKKLDDAKRAMMAATIEQYCGYGVAFRTAQAVFGYPCSQGPALSSAGA
ncbi:MAG TPA: gamma carbonic anhydrase family protein [Bellilinea sp.]|nr:gamma carbonic anhydrase family protein [Bellilinea sp.]